MVNFLKKIALRIAIVTSLALCISYAFAYVAATGALAAETAPRLETVPAPTASPPWAEPGFIDPDFDISRPLARYSVFLDRDNPELDLAAREVVRLAAEDAIADPSMRLRLVANPDGDWPMRPGIVNVWVTQVLLELLDTGLTSDTVVAIELVGADDASLAGPWPGAVLPGSYRMEIVVEPAVGNPWRLSSY